MYTWGLDWIVELVVTEKQMFEFKCARLVLNVTSKRWHTGELVSVIWVSS